MSKFAFDRFLKKVAAMLSQVHGIHREWSMELLASGIAHIPDAFAHLQSARFPALLDLR